MADFEEETSVPLIAVTAAVGAVVLLLILLCSVGKKDEKEKKPDTSSKKDVNKVKEKGTRREKGSQKLKGRLQSQSSFTHPWLASSLKGHSARILGLDFSPNGKYIATTAEDRSVMLWSVKEFNQKEHKFIRANVELDHATHVKFSPDSKAYVVSVFNGNTIRAYKIGKKDDGTAGNVTMALEFPKKHDKEIINIGIASTGNFIMTCHTDTMIKIWDIKGELLTTIDTHQMNNSHGAVSPCGRFVASSGFTPDVKVWEVCFDKTGKFKEVVRAFELKGHKAGVHSFDFNSDSSRMASVSKDGTWRFWDTNVRYQQNQDARLLHTGTYESSSPNLISLSPDSRTVAIATDSNITMFNTITGNEEETIEDLHSSPITALGFDNTSRFLVSSGDKHIQVLHNVVGYKATIDDLVDKERKATSQAIRQRVRQQIEEARTALHMITGEANGTADAK